MSNIYEFVARPKTKDEFRKEFDLFIEKSKNNNWDEFKVMFGFAWGNFVYSGDWVEEIITLEELEKKVKEAEQKDLGNIGDDDLYITPTQLGVEHLFCHEADIHLRGSKDSEYMKEEKERYISSGWTVYEQQKR